MPKKTTVPEYVPYVPEVTITYNRDLKLMSDRYARIKLSHLRKLVCEATDRGFDDDSRVRVASGGFSSEYECITVEAKS